MAHIPDILARIVASKQSRLEVLRPLMPELECQAEDYVNHRRSFSEALASKQPAIIAEIKKASPSAGRIAPEADAVTVGRAYQAAGAAAISVLTDEEYFGGSLADLMAVRTHVDLPVLRKDFTLEEFDVVEAAAYGADAILLIAAILDRATIERLQHLAHHYQMAALVEVHDEAELDKALEAGARIIGVNNRNLHTFEVTLETSLRLAPKLPLDVIKVSESGIRTAEDVRKLSEAGYQAFLVGEHLMKSGNPGQALQALLAW